MAAEFFSVFKHRSPCSLIEWSRNVNRLKLSLASLDLAEILAVSLSRFIDGISGSNFLPEHRDFVSFRLVPVNCHNYGNILSRIKFTVLENRRKVFDILFLE